MMIDLYLEEARQAVMDSPLLFVSLLATLAIYIYYRSGVLLHSFITVFVICRQTVVHVPKLHSKKGSVIDTLVSGLEFLQEEYW